MTLADTIIAMAAAGCSAEQIAAVTKHLKDAGVCENAEAQQELSARQARNRRYYEKRLKTSEKRLKASETSESVLKVSPSLSLKEKSPPITPSKENNPISPPSKTHSLPSAAGDVLKILSECLSIETASDLIAHRKALKSPLTLGSAKGLVKSFRDFGDPEAAAQSMMANGWRGFKSDWMKTEARAGPPRQAQRGGAAHLLAELIEKRNDERQEIFPATPVKLIPQFSVERPDDGGECARLIAGSFKRFS